MSILRVSEPKETNFGSMLYYYSNGKLRYQEFATDDEAEEFANKLRGDIKEEQK